MCSRAAKSPDALLPAKGKVKKRQKHNEIKLHILQFVILSTVDPWQTPVSSWYLLALVGTSIKVRGIWYGALSSCEWCFLTFSFHDFQSMTLGCPGQHLSTSLFHKQLENISTPETLRKWSTTSSCKSHKIIACPGPIDAKEQIGPSTSVKSLGIVNQHPEVHRWTCRLLPWAKRNLMWSLVSRPFCLY